MIDVSVGEDGSPRIDCGFRQKPIPLSRFGSPPLKKTAVDNQTPALGLEQ
jgi:hypothetical protein